MTEPKFSTPPVYSEEDYFNDVNNDFFQEFRNCPPHGQWLHCGVTLNQNPKPTDRVERRSVMGEWGVQLPIGGRPMLAAVVMIALPAIPVRVSVRRRGRCLAMVVLALE